MKKILVTLKKVIRSLVPEKILLGYHALYAWLGALYYGFPTKNMIVIGVTGTKGKTTTANVLFEVLSQKYTVGLITTANIKIGREERLNPWHMTMPGRALIQKLLAEMKGRGVTHVIVETTSEGLKQNRHIGVYYDVAIFTNLSREHLQSHNNSYEDYRKAKEILFDSLGKVKKDGFPHLKTMALVNSDDVEAKHFLVHHADKHITFSIHGHSDFYASDLQQGKEGISFSVHGQEYFMNVFGTYAAYNALPAIALGEAFGVEGEDIRFALAHMPAVPGRMESIDEGQPFLVFVDYAHEKLSMTRLGETVHELKKTGTVKKWIVLLGAEGGGRDKAKRKDMGEIVGKYADRIVISNTDPYDEDEMGIAKEIASYVSLEGKEEGEGYDIVIDRKEGIQRALMLAEKGDIVTITGNGSQQFYFRKGEKVPHDDRVVVKELLHSMGYQKTL